MYSMGTPISILTNTVSFQRTHWLEWLPGSRSVLEGGYDANILANSIYWIMLIYKHVLSGLVE